MIIVFIMVLMMLVISIIVPAQALAYTEKPPPQPHAPGVGGAGGGGGGLPAGGEAAGGEAAGGSGRPSSTRTARRPCRPRRRPRRRPQSDPRGLPSGSKGSGGRGRPGQLCVRGVGMTIIPPAPEGGRVVDRAPAPRRFTVATRIARWDVPSSVRCVWRAWRGRDAACKRSRGADPRADLGRRGQPPPPPPPHAKRLRDSHQSGACIAYRARVRCGASRPAAHSVCAFQRGCRIVVSR